MKTYSLRTSSLVNVVAPLVLTIFVIMSAALWAAYNEISALDDAQMVQLANTLQILTRHEALEGEDIDLTLGSKAEQAKPLMDSRIAFRIWSHAGLVTESPGAEHLGMPTTQRGFSMVSRGRIHWRVFLLRDEANDISIEVAQDTSTRWAFLGSMSTSFLLPLLALIPALLLIVVVGVGRAFGPLVELSRKLDERDTNNLSPVEIERVPIEILPIYSGLNNLFRRVSAGLLREREFTDNAAHELRTPLAALKARAQVMAKSIGPRSSLHASMAELLAIIDRSTGLVEQMLTAARLHQSAGGTLEVSLSKIVQEQIAAFSSLTHQKRQALSVDVTDDVLMAGDAVALMVLVRNLLDNAIRYTPEGGEISVMLSSADGFATLTIADSGPGIPVGDRAKALERFTRFNAKETGTGLGLSIVNWACRMHNTELERRAV